MVSLNQGGDIGCDVTRNGYGWKVVASDIFAFKQKKINAISLILSKNLVLLFRQTQLLDYSLRNHKHQ